MNRLPVVLLVEPSPIFRPFLCEWLKDALTNARILIAANGNEALELTAKEKPAYLLMNINVPDRKSIKLLHQLRQTLPEARIVATSWFESRWFLDELRSAGADGFVIKDKLRSELLPLWEIPIE